MHFSEHTLHKGSQLYAAGRVVPLDTDGDYTARDFYVTGSSDTYTVTLLGDPPHTAQCTCEHGRHCFNAGYSARCSHVVAVLLTHTGDPHLASAPKPDTPEDAFEGLV